MLYLQQLYLANLRLALQSNSKNRQAPNPVSCAATQPLLLECGRIGSYFLAKPKLNPTDYPAQVGRAGCTA
jgi:hypothetical protein